MPCRLTADGKFACCDQAPLAVMGMGVGSARGHRKHVLVLVLSLTKVEQLRVRRVISWVEASANEPRRRARSTKTLMSADFDPLQEL